MRSVSVPIYVEKVHGGVSQAHGVAYVEGEDLVLELQTMILSFIKQQPKTFRIELVDLDRVRHKRSFMGGDTLTIRTRPLDVAAALPGASEGTLELKIKRKHRPELDRLLPHLDLWLEK